MNLGFWKTLPRPIMALAPMADVTDAAFRRIIARYGKPDVMWTEFVSADGLALAPEAGRAKLKRDLLFTEAERPIVAQFFTSSPSHMERAAALARELGFDGVDINMGCPDRSIEKQKAGAALMKDPECGRNLIEAARKGSGGLPISVKTRLGYHKEEIEAFLPSIFSAGPAAVTIHLRTRKEMSDVPARWESMPSIIAMRDALSPETLVLGNGDVSTPQEAREKASTYGCDGVMLGRGIFGNPWLFSEKIPTVREKLLALVEHVTLFEELLGDVKNFAIIKKHFKAYVHGFDAAKELRVALMEAPDARAVEHIIKAFLDGEAG